MSLLDDESTFPSATDETLVTKFHQQHGSSTVYEKSPLTPQAFAVLHYAGRVVYNVKSFLEKNSDVLNDTVLDLFTQTGSKQMAGWFARDIMALSQRGTVKRGYRPPTVGGQFRVRSLVARTATPARPLRWSLMVAFFSGRRPLPCRTPSTVAFETLRTRSTS